MWRANTQLKVVWAKGKPTHNLQISKHNTMGNYLHLMLKKTFFPGNPLLLQSIFDKIAAFKKVFALITHHLAILGLTKLRVLTCQLSMVQAHENV